MGVPSSLQDPAVAYDRYVAARLVETARDEGTGQRDNSQGPQEILEASSQHIIDDDRKADWTLRQIARLKAGIERRRQQVKAELATFRTWQEAEDHKAQRDLDFFQSLLRGYYERLRAAGMLDHRKIRS
jgi:hypothetical protein